VYKVKSGNKEFKVVFEGKSLDKGTVNAKDFEWNLLNNGSGSFHIISDNISYNALVIKADPKAKNFLISINNNQYKINVKDRYDELLKSLGMESNGATKIVDIKAPMPGIVLEVSVKVGQEVKKGDKLIVLEAMKMENILKSPSDGIVKACTVKKGASVEKNQVLINF